jgi:prophage DNA circulation protein
MNRLIAIGKLSALLAGAFALVAIGLCALELRTTANKLGGVADETKAVVIETNVRLAGTTKQLDLVLLQTSETINQVRHVSMDERKFAATANAKTLDVLGHADSLLAHVSDTVDSANSSQRQIAAASVAALQSIAPAAQASTEAMQKAATDLESLNAILRDQNIPLTLQHVNETSAHLESMSQSLDVAVKRWTKPGSFFKSLITGLLDTGSKLAVIAK